MGQGFLDQSTIHGLSDLKKSKHSTARICWVFVLVSALAFLTYNIVVSSIDFYNAPMSTVVRIEHVNKFPPILLCPGGLVLSPQAMESYEITEKDVIFMNGYFWHRNTVMRDADLSLEDRLAAHKKLDGNLERLGMSLPDFIRELFESITSFHPVMLVELKGRSSGYRQTNFHQPLPLFVTGRGVCFHFEPEISVRQGYLSNYIYIVVPSFKKLLENMPLIKDLYATSSIFIGNETLSFVPELPAAIKDNYINTIEIVEARRVLKRTRKAWCEDQQPHISSNNGFYCYEAHKYKEKNCTYLKDFNTSRPLSGYCNEILVPYDPQEWDQCVAKYLSDSMPCDHTQYRVSVQFFDIDEEKYENSTVVKMIYTEVTRLVTEQHLSYTWQQFFSNIGGLISLLCGASVISIVQAVFFVVRNSAKRVFNPVIASPGSTTVV